MQNTNYEDFDFDVDDVFQVKQECKNCECCDLANNTCIRDDSKCYDSGQPLHTDCEYFCEGSWSPQ